MKFSKYLQKNATPEWRSKFIDYKRLKKLVKQCYKDTVKKAPQQIDGKTLYQNNNTKQHVSPFRLLHGNEEEEKTNLINSNIGTPPSSRKLSISSSSVKLHLLSDRNISSGSTSDVPSETSSHDLQGRILEQGSNNEGTDIFKYDLQLDEGLFINLLANNSMFQPCVRHFMEAMQDELNKINQFYAQQEYIFWDRFSYLYSALESETSSPGQELLDAYKELYRGLILLQNYRDLNCTGFRKILKKFDKLTGNKLCDSLIAAVRDEPFYCSKEVPLMIQKIEQIVANKYFKGSRKNAMSELRIHLNDAVVFGQNTNKAFRSGIFLGTAILLIVILVFYYFLKFNSIPRFDPQDSPFPREMFMYKVMIFPILMLLFIALNTVIWKRYKVNYIFIFELDHRNHMSVWDFLQISLIMLNMWCTSLLLFMFLTYEEKKGSLDIRLYGMEWMIPIVLLASFLLILFLPFDIFARRSRFWFLGILWRILCSPFYPVTFAEFWLADQLTSLSEFLFLTQFIFCLYLPRNSSDSIGFCADTLTLSLPILDILPFYARAMQCFRRLIDTKAFHPHATNFGKYASSIIPIILAFIDTRVISFKESQHVWNHWRTAWIITNTFSTIYKIYWDYRMDWGLFDGIRRKHVAAPFLRRDILYHPIWYYLAIIQNFILRWSWVIFFLMIQYNVPVRSMMGFLMPFLELFRRFIWNLFRIELEHTRNCTNLVAVRYISLPYSDSSRKVPNTGDNVCPLICNIWYKGRKAKETTLSEEQRQVLSLSIPKSLRNMKGKDEELDHLLKRTMKNQHLSS